MTSGSTRRGDFFWPALACAFSGAAVFQFLGNSTRSYIGSASLFYWWGFQWVNPRSETQHGLLILGISLFLAARNLGRSRGHDTGKLAETLPPVAAMACGLLLHAVGFVAEQARVSILGLLLFTWGVVAFAGGRRWARATVFPIGFMVFAIPLNALDSAGFWLRMWVVDASAALAHLFGIGVVVNGTQLLSPDGRYDYDVAAACSGVRSLVALAALSLLLGYLRFRSPWIRATFFLISFPLVYVGNVLRILAIVSAAQLGGQSWGDRAHEIMGFGVFVLVLGGVLLAAEVAGRLISEQGVRAATPGPRQLKGSEWDSRQVQHGWRRPLAGALVVVLCAAVVASFLSHVEGLPARGRVGIALSPNGLAPAELPTFLGTDWIGRTTEVSAFERQLLPADTGFSRKTYVSIADRRIQVFLSIVLSGHDRTSIHRPELCLVGQGWTIRSAYVHRFSYPGRADSIPATILRVEKKVSVQGREVTVPQLVAYYFVGGDVIVASHWNRIVLDAWNRVVHGRADRWAYVLIQTNDNKGDADALGRVQTVLDQTLPAFQKQG